MATRDRSLIRPGWYWYFYLEDESAQVVDFQSHHAGVMVPRVTFRGDTSEARIVVFEVRSELRWTLKGLPSRAPKGANTTLADLSSGPAPSPAFVELMEELTGKAWSEAKATAQQANTAVKVLFWGAVAVLLVNLYRSTEPGGD